MKNTKCTTLRNCELVFEEDRIIVIEHTKEEDKEFDLIEDVLKQYNGVQSLSIKIGFDREI